MTDPEQRPETLPAPPGHRLYGLAWVFYLLLAAGAVVWIGLRRGAIELGLFVDPARLWRDLGLGIAAGGALILVWQATRRLSAGARRFEALVGRLLGSLDASQAVALALLSGFAEELFFRGAVQEAWGYWIASVLFGALHTGRDRGLWIWTAFALAAGLLFGGLVLYTGTLLPAIAAHVLVNAVNLVRLVRNPPQTPPD